jgi:hypothetical protein
MEQFQGEVQHLMKPTVHALALPASCAVLVLLSLTCKNPFAPGLDTSPAQASCDPTTPDGVFQCIRVAYTFRDTSDYAPLLDESFVFVYRDYENNIDVTWGRDTELRTTFGLFQNAQRLDLVWTNTISATTDTSTVVRRMNFVRGFNLTVTFNPGSIEVIGGYANITIEQVTTSSPWKIVRWRDESNF